jgi:hypothetical protein
MKFQVTYPNGVTDVVYSEATDEAAYAMMHFGRALEEYRALGGDVLLADPTLDAADPEITYAEAAPEVGAEGVLEVGAETAPEVGAEGVPSPEPAEPV